MSDKHLRRDGDDYGTELLLLLPDGQAWPKAPGTVLDLSCRGLADYYGTVDGRAADLLEIESDPRAASELLPDWERNWALPDVCEVKPPTDEPERRADLLFKMTLLGRQDRPFFIDWAARDGETVTIREYAPYMCGISRVGETRILTAPAITATAGHLNAPEPLSPSLLTASDGPPRVEGFILSPGNAVGFGAAVGVAAGIRQAVGIATGVGVARAVAANAVGNTTYDTYFRWQLGPPELRFYWLVNLEHTLTGIECTFRRYKPAHTDVVFTYRSKLDRAVSLYPWLGV